MRLALRRTGSRQVPGRTTGARANDERAAGEPPTDESTASDRLALAAGSAAQPSGAKPGAKPAGTTRPAGPRSPLRRRVNSAVRISLALFIVGGLYAGFAPGMQAAANDQASTQADIDEGKAIYDASCISCHGRNGQGVPDKGPSLIGAGSAAVEFQVATGRMPLARQEAQGERKQPLYTREQAQQIGAYIQSLGGGPELPNQTDAQLAAGDVARGGTLFRVNCSSCHAFGAGGGALSSGKFAPSLEESTPRDMWAAMLTGPQNMPVFGNNQLTPDEKKDIIAYLQNLQTDPDPGGWGIGRLGPTTEGLAIFLIGMVVLVFTTLWIAGKS
jgi:ubiquinol-cytochrome c reductase cytochrome c subunit